MLRAQAMAYEPSRWNLDDIMPSEKIASEIAELTAAVARFEQYRPLLKTISPEQFRQAIALKEDIARRFGMLGSRLSLKTTENMKDDAARAALKKFEDTAADLQNRMTFFPLWLKKVPPKTLEPLAAAVPHVSQYIDNVRRTRKHALSEKEEQAITLKDATGVSALVQLYDLIESKFTFPVEIDGHLKTLTQEEVRALVYSPRAEVREAAYKSLMGVFAREGDVLGDIYSAVTRDWRTESLKLRGYKSSISVRNTANNLSDPIVETVLGVCRENVGMFQKYFALKKGWLGLSRLRRYDIYAPLAETERKFSYDEGVRLVLDAFGSLSPEARSHVQRIFETRHVDSVVQDGKRSGAFCDDVAAGMVPYILLSWTGKLRDVATLAHECGHGLHDILCGRQSPLCSHPPLPLAETASIFAEQLLLEKMLANETSAIKRSLLAAKVDDAWASIIRQAYFVMFEKEAHEMIANGATTGDLCKTYYSHLQQQFGPDIEVPQEFQWEWTGIPHIFHTPFYCYAYSFGNLLTLALYEQYKQEGASFVPKYMKFLSYGGAASPEHMLTELGIDMRKKSFWQGGFDVIKRRIDELEKLA